MLRIHDEFELQNRLRIRRLTALLLFASGLVVGRYLSTSNDGMAMAQSPAAPLKLAELKLDDRLRSLPNYGASPPDAISLAFPPTAEVLIVSVRSDTKRSR